MDIVPKVQQTIETYDLLQQNDTIVVAVSGGPDSTALLHVLHHISQQWQWQLIVAHVNHQLRGAQADEEANWVQRLAASFGWPCEVGVYDIPRMMREEGLSVQVAARQKRYEFLQQVAAQYGATKIALGHHADDQAETVLMRFMRGSGASGLSGIPIQRQLSNVSIVRPLLHCYKDEILRYCQLYEIDYVLDESNESRQYTRNEVRLDILPYLQRWNRQLPQTLNQLASMMQADDTYMQQQAKEQYARLVTEQGASYCLSKQKFLALPLALQRRLVKLILNSLGLANDAHDFATIERIRHTLLHAKSPSHAVHLSKEQAMVVQYDEVCFGPLQSRPSWDSYAYTVDAVPSTVQISEAEATIDLQVKPIAQLPAMSGKAEVVFDLDAIAFPLTIRNRRPGDRLAVAGLNGSKKVKDIFIDDKIPPSLRHIIPLVVDAQGRLLWIPNVRYAHHAAITDRTERVLHMIYEANI